MAGEYKRSFNVYSAWNYQKEVEDLNAASEQGWQLVRGGCFSSKFVKNPDIRYRYQLDFGKIEDMGRYIEMFREQGWEYVNSTFNGWHYFRKVYDPSQPEEAFEIFTDRESLHEMNSRWARIALALGIILAAFAVIFGILVWEETTIPHLIQMIMFAVESVVLIRGVLIMSNPDASRSRRGDSLFLGIFFATLIAGLVSSIWLNSLRVNFSSDQTRDSGTAAEGDVWMNFGINYPDNYFFDLDVKAEEPMTVEIRDEAGEAVFSETGTQLTMEGIRVKLDKQLYEVWIHCDSAFEVKLHMD